MNDEHARAAFAAYTSAVGGVTYDGKPIPGWDLLTDTVRAGWRAAALAARGEPTCTRCRLIECSGRPCRWADVVELPPNAGPPLVHRG